MKYILTAILILQMLIFLTPYLESLGLFDIECCLHNAIMFYGGAITGLLGIVAMIYLRVQEKKWSRMAIVIILLALLLHVTFASCCGHNPYY